MYEKPELTLVGNAAALVLGTFPDGQDNESDVLQDIPGMAHGLDD